MSMCPVVLRLSRIVFDILKVLWWVSETMCLFGSITHHKQTVSVGAHFCAHTHTEIMSNSVRKWMYGCVNFLKGLSPLIIYGNVLQASHLGPSKKSGYHIPIHCLCTMSCMHTSGVGKYVPCLWVCDQKFSHTNSLPICHFATHFLKSVKINFSIKFDWQTLHTVVIK